MLRECHRILKRGGRIAGFTIHTPAGLSPADREAAAELGPIRVLGFESAEELMRGVGFTVCEWADVTELFRKTCTALLETREQFADDLRAAEGDDVFEEEQAKKQRYLKGAEDGLLLRSFHVAVKS